jgi:hypothetical protein
MAPIVVPTLLALSALAGAASAAIWLEPGQLPPAISGRTYAAGPITVVGGSRCPRNAPALRVVGGELPEGLSLTAAGYLAGTPTQPGRHSFVVRAATDCEAIQQEFELEVTGAPVLSVEPRSVEISLPQGAPPPQDPLVVQVRSSWGGMAYTVDGGDAEWLRATPVRGETPPAGGILDSDALELHVDPSRLPPGTYRVVMRLSTFRGANAPVVPVTLRVLPPVGGLQAIPHDEHSPLPPGVTPVPTAPKATGHGPAPAAKPAAPQPAPQPGRLSRVAPPRRRFAASTPKPTPPPAPAGAHDKPSPSGKPVEHAKPAQQAHAAPPAKPEPPKPADNTHKAEPKHEPAKPTDHGKPAEHPKPAPQAHKVEAPKHEKH